MLIHLKLRKNMIKLLAVVTILIQELSLKLHNKRLKTILEAAEKGYLKCSDMNHLVGAQHK